MQKPQDKVFKITKCKNPYKLLEFADGVIKLHCKGTKWEQDSYIMAPMVAAEQNSDNLILYNQLAMEHIIRIVKCCVKKVDGIVIEYLDEATGESEDVRFSVKFQTPDELEMTDECFEQLMEALGGLSNVVQQFQKYYYATKTSGKIVTIESSKKKEVEG